MNSPRIRNTSHQSMAAFQRSRERMTHVSTWPVHHESVTTDKGAIIPAHTTWGSSTLNTGRRVFKATRAAAKAHRRKMHKLAKALLSA